MQVRGKPTRGGPLAALVLLLTVALAGAGGGCQRPRRSQGAASTRVAQIHLTRHVDDPDLTAWRGRTVLLFTHPHLHTLRNMVKLVDNQLLTTPDLLLVGLYSRHEAARYGQALRLLGKRRAPWVRLHELACRVDAAQVFTTNPCTPVFAALFRRSAGLVFTGGADIPPALYGRKTALTTVIEDPARQYWEVSFLAHLLGGRRGPEQRPAPLLEQRPLYPVLGICMGMQALNVAAGGTLVQDIPTELYRVESYEELTRLDPEQLHRNPWFLLDPAPGVSVGIVHGVRFTSAPEPWPSIPTAGVTVQVVSAHHQSVERLGARLEAIASSSDGKVIEAIRHTRYRRVLGVQFHPERDALFSPGTAARRWSDDAVRNQFAAAMNADPRSVEFYREFWSALGRWVTAAGGGAAQRGRRSSERSRGTP